MLSSLSQSLSFHASAQSFLEATPSPTGSNIPHAHDFVRAKILNRDVTVISSYRHCREILHATGERNPTPDDDDPSSSLRLLTRQDGVPVTPDSIFTVAPAYRELMADFFPAPNLLLLDAPHHQPKRRKWDSYMADLAVRTSPLVRGCIERHVAAAWADGDGTTMDLYQDMKALSWELLCSVFLGLSPTTSDDDDKFRTFVSLQETLLRGQFSLVPVSIRTPFWRSARSKGVDARVKLQALLRAEMASPAPGCLFTSSRSGELDDADRAGNALLFTSSIAAKALSSLLTASLLNVFLFPRRQSSVAAQLRSQGPGQREPLLRSALRETERLSPPVIGVMRRVEQDIQLRKGKDNPADPTTSEDAVTVPAGWDVWLYFMGACRDETVYQQANRLIPERYLAPEPEPEPDPGLAFGTGGRECLGKETVRMMVETVVSVMLDGGWELAGSVDRLGIRGWLGWDEDVPVEMMARDLKQLPVQRPREPIRVQVRRC